MELNLISENKENLNNNNQKINFSKKVKVQHNYLTLNDASYLNEAQTRNIEQLNKKIFNSFDGFDQIDKTIINNNINNNITYKINNLNSNNEEDLDIELNSVSKIIPISDFINIDQMNNDLPIHTIQKEKEKVNINHKGEIFKKISEIKRAPSTNSFFDDIQKDDQFNININDNTNIYDNYPQCSEFNMTNFGLTNRPNIHYNFQNEKDDIFNKTNNITNINTNVNTNNNTNNNKNNNTIFNKKKDLPIKRHNSMITPNINKFLNINNDTILKNTYNNNQFLYDEIQKLKKENKRLFLKNNELSLKIKTQEIKSKTNNNYNNINQKKLTSHKEEFLLQKIKKLESEIIKQRDIITKLTYNKRFNIGIRKIRVNSILIKGNNNKLKRKNSLNNFKLNNLYCNNMYKKTYNNQNLNNTLPNKVNKFVKKKSQNAKNNNNNLNNNNFKSNNEEIFIHIKPAYSSISSSPKNFNKENKSNNIKNKINNTSMYNKDNSINLKLENIDISKNCKKIKKEKIKDKKGNKIDKSKNEVLKSKDENNINKGNCNNCNNTNVNPNANQYVNNYKKIGPHKSYGKTSLIMSVINDNLLGNFNLSQYMIEHTDLNNKALSKKTNLKRNSIY